jgi:hypothetical protein
MAPGRPFPGSVGELARPVMASLRRQAPARRTAEAFRSLEHLFRALGYGHCESHRQE